MRRASLISFLAVVVLACLSVGSSALAGDFCENESNIIFIDKVPSKALPDGADPRQYGRAQDWNGVKGAALDLCAKAKAQDTRLDGFSAAVAALAARLTAVENELGDEVIPTIQAATPTAAPVPGTYSSAQSVTLACASPSPTIRYTIDGSTPTSSSTAYSAPISVSVSTVIRALCQSSGLTDSPVASFEYVIQAAGTPLAFHAQGVGYDAGTGDTVPATVVTTGTNMTLLACGQHVANVAQAEHAPSISSSGGLTWTPLGSAVRDEEFRTYLYTATAPSAGSYAVTWDANTTGEVAKALAVTAWQGVTGFGAPVTDTDWTTTEPLAISLTPSATGSMALMCGTINGARTLVLNSLTAAVQNQTQGFGATLFAGRSSGTTTAGTPLILGSTSPAMGTARNTALVIEIMGNAGGGLDPQIPGAFPTTTALVRSSQPVLAEPALLSTVPFTDLETSVTRVSNMQTHYATDSAWNADESMFMLNDGAGVLHGTSFATLYGARNVPDGGHRWGNTVANKNKVFGANRDSRQWAVLDVPSNVRTTLKTYVAADFGLGSLSTVDLGLNGDGGFDNNDQWAAVVANGVRPAIIGMSNGNVKCVANGGPMNGSNSISLESARMSQDGNWLLVSFSARASDGSKGVDAFRASDCAWTRRLTEETSHFDACVSTAGDQVIVQAYGGATMVRISDGQVTDVDDTPRHHVSCTNRQRPGWAYLSTYSRICDSTLMNSAGWHRIYAVRLDGSKQVQNFAWDHSPCYDDYSNEASAFASPSGTRVGWKARWNAGPTGTNGTGDTLHSFVAGR